MVMFTFEGPENPPRMCHKQLRPLPSLPPPELSIMLTDCGLMFQGYGFIGEGPKSCMTSYMVILPQFLRFSWYMGVSNNQGP